MATPRSTSDIAIRDELGDLITGSEHAAQRWLADIAEAEAIHDRLDAAGAETMTETEAETLLRAIHRSDSLSDIPAAAWRDCIHHYIAVALAGSERRRWIYAEVPHSYAAEMLGLATHTISSYVLRGHLDRSRPGGGILIQSVFRRMGRQLRRTESEQRAAAGG